MYSDLLAATGKAARPRRVAQRLLACAFALGLAVVLLPVMAVALDLEQAKAQGLVGERPDGYIGAVQASPPAEVKQLVEQVNAKRTDLYAKIAKEEGVSVVVVAARSGERLIREARPGHYVLMGTWQKK